MKDPMYYVAQAADCRRLSLRAPDPWTASRLNELAHEFDALVRDLVQFAKQTVASTSALGDIGRNSSGSK